MNNGIRDDLHVGNVGNCSLELGVDELTFVTIILIIDLTNDWALKNAKSMQATLAVELEIMPQ